MGRPRKNQDESTNLSDTGSSSVANHRAADQARLEAARAERDRIVTETKAAIKQTKATLEAKPTDSRTFERKAGVAAKS